MIKKSFNLLLFLFLVSNVFSNPSGRMVCKPIVLPRLNLQNIEVKKEYYAKTARMSNHFRTAVYVLGAGATMTLGAYIIFRLTKKDEVVNSEETQKHLQKDLKDKKGSKKSGVVGKGLSYTDRLELRKIYRKEMYNENMWDLCKYHFKAGVTDWVYYLPVTIFGSVTLGMSSGLYYALKDKFLQLWNGQDKKFFASASRSFALILNQFKGVFDLPEILIDREEIRNDYLVFLDMIESFFALVEEKVDREFENARLDGNSYRAFIGTKRSLENNFTTFAQTLENELNNRKEVCLGKEFVGCVLPSFKKLNNKIVRFLDLCSSVFYED